MLVRHLEEKREGSRDQKGNLELAQGQCTQRVQIGQDLICFGSSQAIFVIFLTDSFIVSFIANLVQVNCLYTFNYINIVR